MNRQLLPDPKRNNTGETIVEVLIATAVIGFALMTAFAIVTRNVASTQDVQEHAYAQKLVGSQVEFLRINKDVTFSGGCFDDAGISISGTSCTVINGGASYTKSIQKNPATGTFKVSISWTTPSRATANETVYYRP